PRYYRQILHIRFFWGMWHVAIQFFYILSFYKLRNLDYLRIDKILDTLALAAGPVYLYLSYYVRLILKPQADIIYKVSFVEQLLKYSVMFTWIIAVAFIARQVYLFIRWKKVYLFKFLMIPIVILIYVVPLLIFKDIHAASQAVIAMHNVQYVSWVWLYYHQRFKGKAVQENRAISYFFKPGRTGHYVFFFLLAGTLFMLVVMKMAYLSHDPHLTFKAITGPFALIHFYLDGRIWKNVNDMM
ncbi:MAG: hypothetical protein KKB52_05520, partial [Candidatus Omnitrophica bacterium]|nr:hypothetical protein [Candidatus Omnitrophota bacterium]